jgi:hypothetical protein
VVIGLEIDHIGNFQTPQDQFAVPSDSMVVAEIDRLYQEGVRYIFPIHVLDNAFGGAAAYESLFDVSNVRESGHPFDLICATWDDDISYTYDNSALDIKNVLGQLVKLGVAVTSISYPECSPSGSARSGQKNSLGLTQSGIVAIKEMMRLGMLIDIDHMSQAAADQALQLANAFTYPVNSGHNGRRGALSSCAPGAASIDCANGTSERSLRGDQYACIGRLHGMAGVGSGGLDAQVWLNQYNDVVASMQGRNGACRFTTGVDNSSPVAAGFGTDTDGLALGMPPRPGSSVNLPPSTDGNWDYNKVGVAHYGMLWDFVQDVRSLTGGSTIVDGANGFMSGADYFYHTWQLAETYCLGLQAPGHTTCTP